MATVDCTDKRELTDDEIAALPQPEPPTLEERKDAAMQELLRVERARYEQGFTYDFGLPIGQKTFQLRPWKDDKANWTLGLIECNGKIASGLGADTFHMRTMDNEIVATTYQKGQDALGAMLAWGKQMMMRKWSLADAIEAAPDDAALDLIDLESGWP